MKSARKAREKAATANAPLLFYRRHIMEFDLVQAISTVGFPIAAFCAILYLLNREREDHKSEVTTLKDVISNINETLAALKQLIEDKLQ